MWRRLSALAFIVLLMGSAFMALPAQAQNGVPWTGQYYNNPTLSDPIALQRTDTAVAFNWGLGSPAEGVNADFFSVRWAQDVHLPAGTYRFFALADDNIRVTFNFHQTVIDTFDSGVVGQLVTADIVVPVSDSYHIQVDYVEETGDAYAFVSYANAATNPQPNFTPPLPNPQLVNPWTVQYFANTALSGDPTAILSVSTPNHNWGTGQPVGSIPADNWSARFTSVQTLAAGTYTASLHMDDGARLFVNGQLLINQFGAATGQTYNATFNLPAGSNTFQIDFVEFGGNAFLEFALTQAGQPAPIPVPPPSDVNVFSTATVTAYRLNVRTAPDPQAQIITRINRNETFPVTGRSADGLWFQLLVNNQLGWSSRAFLFVPNEGSVPIVGAPPVNPDPTTPPSTSFIVTASPYTVNIRSGPGTQYGRIGQIPVNRTAEVVGRNSDATWWNINYNGIVGWVTAEYAAMQAGVNINAIPITG
ncbi:MAG: SH3 domain-containing protein [Anaerolineae bacterium]|nr:SH3 domain-containing protein [Anaerolineae bacterium]